MRRIHLFLIILTSSLSLLIILFAASLYMAATAPTPYGSSWMPEMWGGMGMNGMMGGSYEGTGTYGSGAAYLWIIPVALISIAAVGAMGAAFYLAFPEIRTKPLAETPKTIAIEHFSSHSVRQPAAATPSSGVPSNPYESISKTLTPEELRVLNVLVAHEGKYLQKYIRKEAGLSRLKTHRIVARFAERGIVSLKQSGNTNEIFLADWLKDNKAQNYG